MWIFLKVYSIHNVLISLFGGSGSGGLLLLGGLLESEDLLDRGTFADSSVPLGDSGVLCTPVEAGESGGEEGVPHVEREIGVGETILDEEGRLFRSLFV